MSDDLRHVLDELQQGPVYSLSSLENPESREMVKQADLIFGCDEAQGGSPVLFYGWELLGKISTEGGARCLKTLAFSYDSRTSQLEWLFAEIGVLKGSCDYKAYTDAD
jgi:hypothetical protein